MASPRKLRQAWAAGAWEPRDGEAHDHKQRGASDLRSAIEPAAAAT